MLIDSRILESRFQPLLDPIESQVAEIVLDPFQTHSTPPVASRS